MRLFGCSVDASAAANTEFLRGIVALLQAIPGGMPEDELVQTLLALLARRLDEARIAVHVRDAASDDWRLAGHCGLSDRDVGVLAALVSPPEPVGSAHAWPVWEPIMTARAPWRGLSADLDRECVFMPAMFLDGSFVGGMTVFASQADDVCTVLRDAAPLLWGIRGRGRHDQTVSKHENRYAALAECSPDSIWRLDDQHRIAYVNRTYERVAGTPAEDCVGRHVLDALPRSARERWRAALDSIVGPESMTEVLYTQSTRHYAARLAPEMGAGEHIVGVVATIRDITDAYRWATELEAAKARDQVITEVTRSVVYDRRIADETAYVSPSMLSVFGYAPEQFIRGGLSWWIDMIHPDDRTKFASMFASHENRGDTQWTVEYRVRKADGSWAIALDQGRLVRSGDLASARCIGAVTDITALRALQTQLQHAHRIELIGRLAGGVAHDFNNVLSAIGGFTELLSMSTPPSDPRSADLAEIGMLVRRATGLTQNLLGLSRRRDHSQPIVIELTGAVQRVAPTLRTLLGSGVTLEIHPIPESLLVRMDPGHLDQIILNLAVNARDAMPDGGVVTVKASLGDPADGHGADPYVQLDVSDGGLGIPPEVLELIFQPYFTTKPEGHGTGLGLSVVSDIVQAAGGSISVASKASVGTTFTVRLPLATPDVTSPVEPAPTAEMPILGGTVLLVEDEEAVRRSTKRILEREHFVVIEARTGDAGLASLLAHRAMIDVVVSDLYMPGLSGPALVERMRREAPEIGCLVISGHAERFAKLTAEPGLLAVVAKPCRGVKLIEMINELARATRARRSAAATSRPRT